MWTCSANFFGVLNEMFSFIVCKRLGENYRCWGWKVFSSGSLCQSLGWSDYHHFRGKYRRAFLCSVNYSSCNDKEALSSDSWCDRCLSKISEFTIVQFHVVCELEIFQLLCCKIQKYKNSSFEREGIWKRSNESLSSKVGQNSQESNCEHESISCSARSSWSHWICLHRVWSNLFIFLVLILERIFAIYIFQVAPVGFIEIRLLFFISFATKDFQVLDKVLRAKQNFSPILKYCFLPLPFCVSNSLPLLDAWSSWYRWRSVKLFPFDHLPKSRSAFYKKRWLIENHIVSVFFHFRRKKGTSTAIFYLCWFWF